MTVTTLETSTATAVTAATLPWLKSVQGRVYPSCAVLKPPLDPGLHVLQLGLDLPEAGWSMTIRERLCLGHVKVP